MPAHPKILKNFNEKILQRAVLALGDPTVSRAHIYSVPAIFRVCRSELGWSINKPLKPEISSNKNENKVKNNF
jgi:hypothetical protein